MASRNGKNKSTWEECRPKERRFIEAFLGDAAGDPVQAARLAQFGAPSEVGKRIYSRLREVIDSKLLEREANAIITTKGILTRLSVLADNASKDSDRIKALELLARINGMLADKVTVSIETSGLVKELRHLLPTPVAPQLSSSQVVDATVLSSGA